MARDNLSTARAPRLIQPGFIAVLASLTLGSALITFSSSPKREPVYAGRSVTAWLDDGYEPAALALQELGPPAVPWVFRNLRREHPAWSSWRTCAKLRQHLPVSLVHLLPAPKSSGFDELRAANLLMGMGPPVVPALKTGLKDGNPAVRTACRIALANLAFNTTAAQPQAP